MKNERGDVGNTVSDKNTLQVNSWTSLSYGNLVPVVYVARKYRPYK